MIIDDRPLRFLPKEEIKRRYEEAERILGPERCKQLDKEFEEWLEQRNIENKKNN